MTRTLILGGARSGKSAYAERLAIASGKEVVYLATAAAPVHYSESDAGGDSEMARRIALHRQQRPAHWATVEQPLALGAALLAQSTPDNLVLVDCLTLWLTNLLFCERSDFPDVGVIELPPRFHAERQALFEALASCPGEVLLVSNEVGMGIVPYGAISRCFTDEAGRLNQAIAAACERAVLIVAGLPLVLKGAPC